MENNTDIESQILDEIEQFRRELKSNEHKLRLLESLVESDLDLTISNREKGRKYKKIDIDDNNMAKKIISEQLALCRISDSIIKSKIDMALNRIVNLRQMGIIT